MGAGWRKKTRTLEGSVDGFDVVAKIVEYKP